MACLSCGLSECRAAVEVDGDSALSVRIFGAGGTGNDVSKNHCSKNHCRAFDSDDCRPRGGLLHELENFYPTPDLESVRRRLCLCRSRCGLRTGAEYHALQMEYQHQDLGYRVELGQT